MIVEKFLWEIIRQDPTFGLFYITALCDPGDSRAAMAAARFIIYDKYIRNYRHWGGGGGLLNYVVQKTNPLTCLTMDLW